MITADSMWRVARFTPQWHVSSCVYVQKGFSVPSALFVYARRPAALKYTVM